MTFCAGKQTCVCGAQLAMICVPDVTLEMFHRVELFHDDLLLGTFVYRLDSTATPAPMFAGHMVRTAIIALKELPMEEQPNCYDAWMNTKEAEGRA